MAMSFSIVGYVTKKTSGPLGYAARSAKGTDLGSYNSVGEAKRAVMQYTTGKMFTWTREDLNGSIEAYTATALVPTGFQQ